jgi:hypothetical protein
MGKKLDDINLHDYNKDKETMIPTRQQAFDMAAKHLISTGKPSVDEGRFQGCIYSGSGCAMRPFLGNDLKRLKELDNQGGLDSVNKDLLPKYVVSDFEFYTAIQLCHDTPVICFKNDDDDANALNQQWRVEWRQEMFKVANKYGLNTHVFLR